MVDTNRTVEQERQHRPPWALPAFAAFSVALVVAALVGWPDLLATGLRDEAWKLLQKPVSITWLVGVPTLLLFERLFPIDKPSFRDPVILLNLFYSLIATPALIITVAFVADWQNGWVADHISLVDLDFFETWHPAAVGVFAFVTSDLLLWVTHMIMHKTPFLWRIHEIHHAPERLNLFAADRGHPGETLFRTMAALAVIALIGPSVIDAQWLASIALLVGWWLRFVHSNVRLSLGPLRYVLVTPQSHRIHHSARPDHWDSNYGFILSIWDWIFRTQNPDRTSYPPTGIGQPAFPVPQSAHPREMATAFAAQMAWPFRRH